MKKILITLLLMLMVLVGCGEATTTSVEEESSKTENVVDSEKTLVETSNTEKLPDDMIEISPVEYSIENKEVKVLFKTDEDVYVSNDLSYASFSDISLGLHTEEEAIGRWGQDRVDMYPFTHEYGAMYFHRLDVLCDAFDQDDTIIDLETEEKLSTMLINDIGEEKMIDAHPYSVCTISCYQPQTEFQEAHINLEKRIFIQAGEGIIIEVNWSVSDPEVENILLDFEKVKQFLKTIKINSVSS